MFQGLRADQGPPADVPLRFLAAVPLLMALIGLIWIWYGANGEMVFASRWSNPLIGTLHIFTLGVLSMAIFGAMMQMLPVLAGVVLPRPRLLAAILQPLLLLAALLLGAGFLFNSALLIGKGTLIGALLFTIYLLVVVVSLLRAKSRAAAWYHFLWPQLALLMLFLLGLKLGLTRSAILISPHHLTYVDLHLLWALIGWVVLTIFAVAFQALPMFYVAPAFPAQVSRWFSPAVLVLLIILTLLAVVGHYLALPAILSIIVTIALFLLVGGGLALAISLLHKRRRKVGDTTLDGWFVALYTGLFSMALAIAALTTPAGGAALAHLAALIGISAILLLIHAMALKIVPFLVWLHLVGAMMVAPSLREMVPQKLASGQLTSLGMALVIFTVATLVELFGLPLPSDLLLIIAGGLLILSESMLLYLIVRSVRHLSSIRNSTSPPSQEPSL